MKKAPVSLALALAFFASLFLRVMYGLGKKAPEAPFFQPETASESPDNIIALLRAIRRLDCSGFVRLILFLASYGKLKIPDGSQNQRDWCERMAKVPDSGVREVNYRDAARYMTGKRLFICFIKPNTNGCGDVGHVWLLVMRGGKAMTLESHGGRGVNSRAWDTAVLLREHFSCFELVTTESQA